MNKDPATFPVMDASIAYEILLRPTKGEMMDFIINEQPTHENLLGTLKLLEDQWSDGRPLYVGEPHTVIQYPSGKFDWHKRQGNDAKQAAPSFSVYRDMLRVARFADVKSRERCVLECSFGGVKIGDVIIKPTACFGKVTRQAIRGVSEQHDGSQSDGCPAEPYPADSPGRKIPDEPF